MYQRLIALLLSLLRVPHDPVPPHGDPASVRVFRAGRNFLKLKLLGWGVAQVLAFAAILFWVGVFMDLELAVDTARDRALHPPAPAEVVAPSPAPAETPAATVTKKSGKKSRRVTGNPYVAWRREVAGRVAEWPTWIFPALWILKGIGLLAYFAQLPVTYLIARLDYELRWYMVTDRSLRIRHGVWKVSESTMSFANIQQVVVSQGPLQRLLGLSDVKVQSAGGGGAEGAHGKSGEDMHLGLFHSVTNAPEIRDLILERLRRFRESGLGDPDEKSAHHVVSVTSASHPAGANGRASDTLAAAQELLAEARALRAVL